MKKRMRVLLIRRRYLAVALGLLLAAAMLLAACLPELLARPAQPALSAGTEQLEVPASG